MTQPSRWCRLYDDSWGVKLFHNCGKPGDVVTVPRRDGTASDERLKTCLSEGPSWSLWRVFAPGEALGPSPRVNVQARRPIIRRGGSLVKLPVIRPEPAPPTDADTPRPEDDPEDDPEGK